MQLIRCSCQSENPDLAWFYARALKNANDTQLILTVFQMLEDVEITSVPSMFWLLSHTKICLLSEDNFQSPRWVTVDVGCSPFGKLEVACRVPSRTAPWPNAYVQGYAKTPEEAVAKIVAGIEFSQGWAQTGQ